MPLGSFRSGIRLCRVYLIGLVVAVVCLAGDLQAQHPRVRTFSETEGLPSAQVRGLAEDQSGRLWILTRGGLTLYNGREMVPAPPIASIQSEDVGLLTQDPHGGIWVTSSRLPIKVARFWQGEWQALPKLSTSPKGSISAFVADETSQGIFAVAGSLGNGLFVFQNEVWTRLGVDQGLASSFVNALAGDHERLYIGTSEGLQSLAPRSGSPEFLGENPRLREAILSLKILHESPTDSRLAVLTPNWFGLVDLESGDLEVLAEDFDLLGTASLGQIFSAGSIAGGGKAGYYFGTAGVAYFLEKGSRELETLGIEEGLRAEGMTSVLKDRSGGVWLGSVRGLNHISSRRFLIINRREGLPEDEVTALLESSPGQWILAQNRGLSQFRNGELRSIDVAPKLVHPSTTRVMELMAGPRGNVWIAAMERGLGRLDSNGTITWSTTETGLPSVVQSVAVDGDRLWIAAGSDGVFSGDGQTFQREDIGILGSVFVRRVFASPDLGILAATDRGLLIRRGDAWTLMRSDQGDRSNNLFCVALSPHGEILVGGLGGLFRLDTESLVEKTLGSVRIERPVFSLLFDSSENLWAGTDDGVFLWNGATLRNLSVREGLAGRDVNRGALIEDHMGRIWIGTDGGASIYRRELDSMESVLPVAEIVAVEAGGEPLGDASEDGLPHWRNHLFFQVEGVSLAAGSGLRCRYRLDGFDAGWTELAVLPQAPIRYTNLPSGRYRFDLKVGFGPGTWSDTVSSPEIFIKRPLWQRPWLLAVALLALAILGWWLYRSYALRRHASLHDSLTGLPNRVFFEKRLSGVMNRWQNRIEPPYAVLFLDVDRFKNVNDSLGHGAGDQLLETIAQRLRASIHSRDIVGRLSGDEFTVLLDEIDSAQRIGAVAERLQRAFEPPFRLREHEVFAGISIGIAVGASHYQHPAEILRDADIAMYRAKERGRGCYEFFSPEMHATAVSRLRLETGLRRALERDELRIAYQPIVSLESGEPSGCEALLRWQHPNRGLLLPGEFLGMAEETGLILAITDWALERSCLQLKNWRQSGVVSRRDFSLNINLSPRQLFRLDLAERLVDIVDRYEIPRDLITLELTESAVMDQVESARWVLERCQELGLQVALDDFGTGHSSLSQLQRLPVSELKLDWTFVSDLETNAASREIVRTVVGLGRNLNLRVIAEGVETQGQRRLLQELGCVWAQGFLFSEPVDGDSFDARVPMG